MAKLNIRDYHSPHSFVSIGLKPTLHAFKTSLIITVMFYPLINFPNNFNLTLSTSILDQSSLSQPHHPCPILLSNTFEQIRPVNGWTRPVRVVKQWFTSRTDRGAMVTCISLVRQVSYLDSTTRSTCTNRTSRETMVYESYRSWNNGDLHIISMTARLPQQYDPYDPCDSYGS